MSSQADVRPSSAEPAKEAPPAAEPAKEAPPAAEPAKEAPPAAEPAKEAPPAAEPAKEAPPAAEPAKEAPKESAAPAAQVTPSAPPAESLYPSLEVYTEKTDTGVACLPKNYAPKEARKEKKKHRAHHAPKTGGESSSSSDDSDDDTVAQVADFGADQLMQRTAHKEALAPKYMYQSSEGHLMSVEFFPVCKQKGNKVLEICPRFENFSTLMRQANFWLANNPNHRCLRCETIKKSCSFDGTIGVTDPVIEGSKFGALCYVRGLRMWVMQRSDIPPQELWYINVVPKPKHNPDNKIFPEFEDIRTTLNWMNTQFGVNPIPGTVLNMEQMELIFTQWNNSKSIDLDKGHWLERQNKSKLYLIGLRIYYIMGPPLGEKIGINSILPECVHRSGMQRPKVAGFDTLIKGAIKFIGQNLTVRITDLQTFRIYVNREGGDTKWKDWNDQEDAYRSFSYDNSAYSTGFSINTLRIIYTFGGPPTQFLRSGLLTTKVFVPFKIGDRSFEGSPGTLCRVNAWMNATRAKIVSAETISVFHNPEGEIVKHDSCDTMFTKLTNHKYLTCYRFYIDGIVDEPQANQLPPPPPRAQSSCCTVL